VEAQAQVPVGVKGAVSLGGDLAGLGFGAGAPPVVVPGQHTGGQQERFPLKHDWHGKGNLSPGMLTPLICC